MLCIALNQGKAQEITLQPLDVYEQSLKAFHTQKRDAARTEYVQTNKRKWWYYLPNVGLGLTYPISQVNTGGETSLTTRARLAPSINLGTGVLANIDQTRNTQKAKLAAIDADAQFQYRVELHELRSRYEAILIEKTILKDQEITNRMENNIFANADDANRKKEIKKYL
ncbi:hypothetical protein [Spirosoma sp. KNUC1025]|uniref:hypothetical protein n=1 Tax=Spirosoma sp. KNUC1025 TaxID=2894082 RepID=UPI001E45FC4D|nr:hypothetical protein [Spirosoma sp. KNUC1025]UFH57712.1 hypothetical protein LN737_32305 [Spirosoma sp. KNUC1025]